MFSSNNNLNKIFTLSEAMSFYKKVSILIVVYRGTSYIAPENTIPAFDIAFQEKADFIECDFWLTKDNEIVFIHDSNTSMVGNKSLDVKFSTPSELKKFIWESGKENNMPEQLFQLYRKFFKLFPNKKRFISK